MAIFQNSVQSDVAKGKIIPCFNPKRGFTRGSVRCFILGTKQDLGQITALRIWHDSRGRSPEWYLHRITVEELATGKVYFFNCDQWLAVDRGQGLCDRLLCVTSDEDISRFTYLWKMRWMNMRRDANIFTSVTSACRSDLRARFLHIKIAPKN